MAETKKAATAAAPDEKKDTPAAAPAAKAADTAKAAEKPKAEPAADKHDGVVTGREREKRVKAGQCVVDDGTAHVGGAVNGVVCSAHAMRYDPHGNRREAR